RMNVFVFRNVRICLLSRVQSLCVSHGDFHLGSQQSIHTSSSSSSFLFLCHFFLFFISFFLSFPNILSPSRALSLTEETGFLSLPLMPPTCLPLYLFHHHSLQSNQHRNVTVLIVWVA